MASLRYLLIIAFAASMALTVATPAVAAQGICTAQQLATGTCPTVGGEIVGGGVELGAEVGLPGSGNGGGNGSGNGNASGNGNGSGNGTGTSETSAPGTIGSPGGGTREIIRDDYFVTGPVTLSDLVNFRPTPGLDSMEPDGWMIVGLDTNFYATAGVQVQNGLLLGEQAQVRFTPVRYHWTYGDGAARSASTPGATWRSQGLGEFDPTPTSHVYTASGTYYIDLTIDFAAEYRWAGGSWTSIAGTIPVPANRLVAIAGGAKTVLVEQECTLNPTGPGC